jgi:hypothetical protein
MIAANKRYSSDDLPDMLKALQGMRGAVKQEASNVHEHVKIGYSNPMQKYERSRELERDYFKQYEKCKASIDLYQTALNVSRQKLQDVGVHAPQYPQWRDDIQVRERELRQFQQQLGAPPLQSSDSDHNIAGCLEDLDLIRIDYATLDEAREHFEKTRGVFAQSKQYPDSSSDKAYRKVALVLNDVRNLKRDTQKLLEKTDLSPVQRAALKVAHQEALKLEAEIVPDVGASGRKRFEQYMAYVDEIQLEALEGLMKNEQLRIQGISKHAYNYIEKLEKLHNEQSEVWRVREIRSAIQSVVEGSARQKQFDALRQFEITPAQVEEELQDTYALLAGQIQQYTGIIADLERLIEHQGKALLVEQPELEDQLNDFKQALKQLKEDAKEPWSATRVVTQLKDLLSAATRFFKAIAPTTTINWEPAKKLVHQAGVRLMAIGTALMSQQETKKEKQASPSSIDILIAGIESKGTPRGGFIHDLGTLRRQLENFEVLKQDALKRARGEDVVETHALTQGYRAQVQNMQDRHGAGSEPTSVQYAHTQFKKIEEQLNRDSTRLITDIEGVLKNSELTPVQRAACETIHQEAKGIQAKAHASYQENRTLKAYEKTIDYQSEDLPITLESLKGNN